MAATFSSFTTILGLFVVLLVLGIIFEKQLIALEDKFDAFVMAKRNSKKSSAEKVQPERKIRTNTLSKKNTPSKESKSAGFAA